MDSSVEDNVCVRSFLPTTDLLPPWNGARGEGRQRCEGECAACRPHVCVCVFSPPDPKRVSTVDDSLGVIHPHSIATFVDKIRIFVCFASFMNRVDVQMLCTC